MKNRLSKVTHCARHIPSNTRPHQWHWGDQEMGTTVCHAVRWLPLFIMITGMHALQIQVNNSFLKPMANAGICLI